MASTKQVLFLVAMIAISLFAVSAVSASSSINDVEVNGVSVINNATTVATFTGDVLPVKVVFSSTDNATDVRVKAWISGDRELAVSSERFDVIANGQYSRLIAVPTPSTLDSTDESLQLNVVVESRSGELTSTKVSLRVQRDSYVVEVLDVNMDSQVKAGESLPLDIVLKNRGSHLAEDTFVKVSIPELGIQERAYFGDLSSVDQSNPDREDAAERRMVISIPSKTPAGLYDVVIESFNADSSTTVTKRLAVVSTSDESVVVSSSSSKTFATGDSQKYNLILVNSGNKVKVYNLVFDTADNLNVEVEDSVVVVPAGSSKTVPITVSATKAGKYTFAANVNSDGELVKTQVFTANVEGSNVFAGSNATVLLTVVLAIVFVVLLVVLIVLLTRKPEKAEEYGESYY